MTNRPPVIPRWVIMSEKGTSKGTETIILITSEMLNTYNLSMDSKKSRNFAV